MCIKRPFFGLSWSLLECSFGNLGLSHVLSQTLSGFIFHGIPENIGRVVADYIGTEDNQLSNMSWSYINNKINRLCFFLLGSDVMKSIDKALICLDLP